jgi:hypothetical protein
MIFDSCDLQAFDVKDISNTTKKNLRNKLTIFSLVSGIICFGFILPDSLSDHEMMLHFSAHFGMSFLILSFTYALCSLQWKMRRIGSYTMAILITLIVGSVYKYEEIASQGILHRFDLGDLLSITGCYTSMSQNMAGIFAGMLIIQFVFSKRVELVKIRG